MKGYLYDPHTHTSETSACGYIPAAEVVDQYRRNGFTGFAVTDHLHAEYVFRNDYEHDWNRLMDHYLRGYKAAKARGDEVGVDVILGAEMRFPENDNDYLVYGIDEAWLRSHPYVCYMSAQEFYDKYHDEVLIIQAHPYRGGNTTVFESAIHGCEIINAHPRHQNHNDLALALSRRHPEYYRLAGSDTHEYGDECRAGVILPERVKDSYAYREMIMARQFRLWSKAFPKIVEADREIRQAEQPKAEGGAFARWLRKLWKRGR